MGVDAVVIHILRESGGGMTSVPHHGQAIQGGICCQARPPSNAALASFGGFDVRVRRGRLSHPKPNGNRRVAQADADLAAAGSRRRRS